MTIEYITLLISVFFFGNVLSVFAYECFGILGVALVGTAAILAMFSSICYGIREGEFKTIKQRIYTFIES